MILHDVFDMHLNDFYEFGSIKPNSKKHRNIEKIRFGSVRYSRKVLEFHYTIVIMGGQCQLTHSNSVPKLNNINLDD